MEGTAGADGTDVAGTGESEHNITLQHTCLYVG